MQFLLVDDHSLFRQGLNSLLKRLKPSPQVTQASSGKEALLLASKTAFALVLLDLHLPDLDGRSVLKRLLRSQPQCRVLMLSGSGDASSASACLKAGAIGYLSKTLEAEALLDGIKEALAGKSVVASHGPQRSAPVHLPPSQMQVLRLLCLGKTNKEIAADLGLSANTIRNHLAVIFRSLTVSTRTEAAHQARILGLV